MVGEGRRSSLPGLRPPLTGEAYEYRKISAGKTPQLPVEKKQVLDFVETLEKKATSPGRRRSLKGLWADLGAEVSPEDIAEARREMWGGFPRGDV